MFIGVLVFSHKAKIPLRFLASMSFIAILNIGEGKKEHIKREEDEKEEKKNKMRDVKQTLEQDLQRKLSRHA